MNFSFRRCLDGFHPFFAINLAQLNKLLNGTCNLTLYQKTNFGPVQIQSICRQKKKNTQKHLTKKLKFLLRSVEN